MGDRVIHTRALPPRQLCASRDGALLNPRSRTGVLVDIDGTVLGSPVTTVSPAGHPTPRPAAATGSPPKSAGFCGSAAKARPRRRRHHDDAWRLRPPHGLNPHPRGPRHRLTAGLTFSLAPSAPPTTRPSLLSAGCRLECNVFRICARHPRRSTPSGRTTSHTPTPTTDVPRELLRVGWVSATGPQPPKQRSRDSPRPRRATTIITPPSSTAEESRSPVTHPPPAGFPARSTSGKPWRPGDKPGGRNCRPAPRPGAGRSANLSDRRPETNGPGRRTNNAQPSIQSGKGEATIRYIHRVQASCQWLACGRRPGRVSGHAAGRRASNEWHGQAKEGNR